MSLRSIPSIVFALIIYNAVVFVSGGTEVLGNSLFELPMLSGGHWSFKVGDAIILLTLFLLFAELIKSTYTSTSSLVDHGLSMVLFVVCLIEFLLAPLAATSTFFLITVATAIDVIAGFTIGIRVARRDLAIGGMEH
ncbi:hypothetical protein [Hyphomicrobium sulfonivorans]|uniref:Transmembrane protein n=1 Tax=Hyphomicrobium sulfonivorans TaxID=121290 RepID=A0A109BBN3_HYPSL|nr:hypothetical protein [Hyphomicrobium sulfonivorans]KWT65781.1 hypothetical protein APY04_2628 [Hyphomicrobium sulfonivorans]MBI1648849.1 hypothetical protein [Hyphomicrobium sulfonivorans]NSL70616.1 hypothetical protein [Hyphomicrobium sulfonivorans]